jgi:pyruvate dehydrogenase E2 component (dihydrolipoamide acetyltransferase)
MPALGMQQDTGTLVAWLLGEGESVVEGELIMEIETDKAAVEIEAPASGILAGICADEGEEIQVGQVVAWILEPGEELPEEGTEDRARPPSAPAVAHMVAEERGLDLEAASRVGQPRLAPASPKARRLARERGLDVEKLMGTGPGGAVVAADLPLSKTEPGEPGSMWLAMADRVTQSWASAPHFFLLREVNASRLVAWRAAARQHIEPGLTYTDLLVRLVAAALRRHPQVNASWSDGTIVLHQEINIGLAAAVPDGLVVPVIHRANEQSLSEIAVHRQDLVQRAQAGRLGVEDLADGTFTISNLGMYGVDAFLAILNPPQAAILAVGRIAERVVPMEGQPAVQPMMALSLSCDHRVIDGVGGAQFLETLADLIEEPLLLEL